jgi:Bacterial Ig-like domain (group 1)/Invasin, domain 3
LTPIPHGGHARHTRRFSIRHRTLATAFLAALLASVAVTIAVAGTTPGVAGADLVSGDGFTTLTAATGATPGPYTSGQVITVSVGANSTLSAAGQAAGGAPAPNGSYYFEECSDPGGTTPNLPTSFSGCEAGTLDIENGNTSTGAVQAFQDFTVYDLPDVATVGGPTMTGQCDVAPNQCVIGIFAANPNAGHPGFSFPHLFSAPFNMTVGDGLDQGDNPGDGTAPAVSPTSPANSTLLANSPSVAADGVNAAQITVTLKDTANHPVTTGKSVTLSQGSGHSIIEVNGTPGSTATTNGSGQAVFTAADTTAEPVTYTATDTTDTVTVTQTAQVIFAAPVASASNSSISALSTSVPQSGSTTVTVTLKDQGPNPQPIAGKLMTLTQGSGSSSIMPATTGSATTDAQGKATFTVSDSTAETVTYSATDTTDGIALTGQSVGVTFGTLTVSASQSTVTTSTPVVATSGSGVPQTNGTVTVTLLAGTSPVAGKTVTLTAPSSNALITPSSQTTGAAGTASFSVSDATAESATFKAVDSSDNNLAITATAQVMFEAPAASPSKSTVTVSPSAIVADGTTSSTLTATIDDQFGNPLAGKTVTMVGTVTGTSNPSATARVVPGQSSGGVEITTTNGNGVITFGTNDTTAESVTYTATDTTDNLTVTQTGTVTFTAAAPQVSQSTVEANPTSVPADGSTKSTITVTVEDHNANPVPGITVMLTALNGSSVIAPALGVATDPSGKAAFKVSDASSEVVRYRATDITDNLPFVGEEVQVTFGTPPPTAPAVADSDIVASSTTVPADGHSSATVEVILNDGNGLPLQGKSVSLIPISVHAVVSPATVSTDSNGVANFTVTDHTAESVTLSATDITDNAPLTGLSVTISFTPAAGQVVTAGAGLLNEPIVGTVATGDGGGYWLVASDGGIFNYGDAAFYGSTGAIPLNKPVVGMAATPDGRGYWLVASDGGIFNYGDAAFYGSMAG